MLFGVWALVHVAVFCSQKGIFHPYYVSALAPAVAALAGAGIVLLARRARTSWAGVAALAAAVAGTAWLAVDLLARTPDFAPWLRVAIPVAAGVAIVALVAAAPPASAGAGRWPSPPWRSRSPSAPARRRTAPRTWAGRSTATT